MELDQVVRDVKDAIVGIDASLEPLRAFQPGVGTSHGSQSKTQMLWMRRGIPLWRG